MSRGIVGGSEREERILRGEEDQSMFTHTHTHTYIQIHEDSIYDAHQTLFEKGGRREDKNKNTVNLFQVHCMHA
jgi:hypothetical protein